MSERKIEARNLSEGRILPTLIKFGMPFLVAFLLQSLYGAVDLAVVGWFCDSAALAATSMGSNVLNIITNAISGLTVGGSVLLAQYIGARREEDAVETLGAMITIFLVSAAVLTGVMFAFSRPILQLCNTPPEAMDEAMAYTGICSCGIIFIFGYNAMSAMLRGIGDSKHPMIFVGIACVINVVLDLLLIGPMGMGPAGAAVATVIAQGISLVISAVFVRKRVRLFSELKAKHFIPQKEKTAALFKLGLPLMLQNLLTNISFLIIMAIASGTGVAGTAAIGIVGKFNGFAMLPAIACSSALSAFTAQNVAAQEYDRARRTLWASIALCSACALAALLWAQLWPKSILFIFGADEAVAAAGADYLRTFSIDFMLVAWWFCFSGFFNGCGKTAFTMLIGIMSSVVLRMPLALIADRMFTGNLTVLGLAAPCATVAGIVAALLYLRTGKWKTYKLV